ncbi:hypothetical protein SARC_01634 [Sphaeroforma arctica JP610]|uniref:Uncharacterized protein n=1 Tax=Sphaeroforma arctica JP610 TaxID=667725 RepID=A0A0L0GB49_9EUKA|nr:hypothetical protein SARC_01634 [Sphaeroforma arctica JP610]KNC86225.1 hypothetical protein SARC_01634 [Sphaeroforma arctica JP610]|eukprot:XP_014160127.1 hypothetical protein SARC_01634 [Sphaeroforma arctica JP610]
MLFRPTDDEKMTARPLSKEENEIMPQELAAIKLAEEGKLEEAYAALTQVLVKVPTYASAHNNRAQVLRLLKKDDEALEDLTKAIELSEGKGKVAENAYFQRAALYKFRRDEDKARDDFQKAADLGNIQAKEELVALNPYARMCNQMLAEVMNDLGSLEESKKASAPSSAETK